MTRRLAQLQILARAEIVAPPALAAAPRACTDHSFELPPVLHLATAALFVGFVGVLSFAFRNPEMAIPFGICIAFIAAFFAVPAIFLKTSPVEGRRALSWSDFRAQGIATATGRTGALEATTLVLILPVLLLVWAISIAVIAATVG